MAEVVGIIASGAGIATLGGQILESVFKLQQIVTAIRDAPEELKTILEEIAIVTDVLIQCSQQSRSSPSGTTQSGARDQALLYCETACKSLFAIVSEIEDGIRGPKLRSRWYSFQAVLKAKTIANLVARLERAKSTLALAQLMYLQPCGAEQRDWKESTSLVSAIQQPEVSDSSTIIRPEGHNKHRSSHRKTTYHLGIGILIMRQTVRTDGVNLSSPEDVRVEFRFAEWFLAWGVNIATRRESGLFNIAIRTYRVIPADSAIFKACAIGDDEVVTRLIQEGKASPFDMTSKGVTPLHVAAAWCHPSTSKQLLDYGADGSLAVEYDGDTFNSLILAVDSTSSYNEYLFAGLESLMTPFSHRQPRMRETMRVLTEHDSIEVHQGYEPVGSGYWDLSESALHKFMGSSEDFLWLIKREDAFMDAQEWDDYVASIVLTHIWNTDVFPAAWSQVSNVDSLAKFRERRGATLLHYLLTAHYRSKPGYLNNGFSIFTFVRTLLEHGADPTARTYLGNTPLMTAAQGVLLFFWIHDLPWTTEAATEKYSELLALWVQTLESCNIDMREYRAKEIEAGAEEFKAFQWFDGFGPQDCIPDVGNKHWFVRLVFEQAELTQQKPFQIKLDFRSVDKDKIMPGTWSDDLVDIYLAQSAAGTV